MLAAQIGLLVALVLVPPATHWPTPAWVLGVASVLTLGGMVVVVVSVLRVGRALTEDRRAGRSPRLVTDGLHRWVRHPLYSGLLVVVAGVVLRSGNVVALALGAALVAVLHQRARREEALLYRQFPGYAAYAAATPRFVPRPGRRPTAG